jgi:stress response protein SCP2
MELDIACFGVDAGGELSDDRYMIFYNQPSSPQGEIRLLGGNSTEQERFAVDLGRLPAQIDKLVFTLTVADPATLADLHSGYIRWSAGGVELVRFAWRGTDFASEKAIMVAEIYRRDPWRIAAVGQGFNGGLAALVEHFGGEVAAPAPAKVSLQKRLEQGGAAHLLEPARALAVTLEKKHLSQTVAKVALVLDNSGSMRGQYRSGRVQKIVDRAFPLAVQFDDDGELECWAYGDRPYRLPPVSFANLNNVKSIHESHKKWPTGGNNQEADMVAEIIRHYQKSSLPVYVMFVTDGGIDNSRQLNTFLVESARMPIFWQFMGSGGSNYGPLEQRDKLAGRVVDNANFFALDDIAAVSDGELYERLLGEFPAWLAAAKSKGILP